MFQSATLKLTLWYLAIVMTISIMFSGALYGVTTHELDRGLRSETQRIFRQIPDDVDLGPKFRPPRPDTGPGSQRILRQLIGFNLIVLAGAGLASYYLARRTLQPIEAAHEQQKRFTADVTHELRTPLTALRMENEVGLLNAKSTAPQLRTVLKSNLEEVDKLEALINNLLRLANLEANEVQQQFGDIDSKDSLESAVAQVGKIAETRGITIESSIQNGAVHGDADSLNQLFVILLDNAVKYSPDKSTITVNSKTEGDNVVIKIKDNGTGIDKATLPHVFDRFYRADSSRTDGNESSGFGLGLSIAKTITDLHNGTIELSSKVGKGTTAKITLPKL